MHDDAASVSASLGRPIWLATPRLAFGAWREQDADLAHSLWGDAGVMKYLNARGGLTREASLGRLRHEIALAASAGVQYWPLFVRETGAFAGCCGLKPRPAPPGVLEIGFHLVPEQWGKGFAREASLEVMRHAFEERGVPALFAGHHPENEASRAVLTKLGFAWTHDEQYAPTGRMHPGYLLTRETYVARREV